MSQAAADPARRPFWKRAALWRPLLVLAAASAPYLGVLDSPFFFDDVKLVRDNEEIRDLRNLPRAFNIFSKEWDDREVRANYRPMRFLSYAVDYAITRALRGNFPPDALPTGIFHVHNVLLHALNAILLLAIGRLLLGEGGAPLFLALAFALHPIATEAVTYVSGRRDVLSTFYYLLVLWIHLRWERWWTLIPAVPLFAAGLLSKEMAATLPAAILLIDLARRAPLPGRSIATGVILLALAIAFALFQASNPALAADPVGGSRWSTLLTAPRYAARYLGLVLFPYPQSLDYSFDAIPASASLASPATTLPAILLAAALGGAGIWCLARRRLVPAVGLLWFLGTLVPVLHLIPFPERFAERFVYLPSIGLFFLAAGAFRAALARSRPVAIGAAALLLAVLGLAAAGRNRDWRSPLELWGSAARAQPRAARAHLGYADALRDSASLREAVQEYGRALEIWETAGAVEPPRAANDDLLRWGYVLRARASRAECSGRLGEENAERYRGAIDDLRWLFRQRDIDGTPIAGSPRFLNLRYNLANCLLGLSQKEDDPLKGKELRAAARAEFLLVAAGEAALPESARNAHYYLSKLHLAEGKGPEALAEMEEAYRIAREKGGPRDRYALAGELADLLIAQKQLDRADEILTASIGELGQSGDRKHLLYRRARIADRKGSLAAAARRLEECLEIDPDYEPALLTLARMEEGRGRLERAEELYRRLLARSPGNPDVLRGLKTIELRKRLDAEGKGGAGSIPGSAGGDGKGSVNDRGYLSGLLHRGEQHLAKGEVLAAIEPFRRVAVAPDPPPAAEGNGTGAGAAGAVVSNRDLRARALRGLGLVARELRKFPEAEAYYRSALNADPEFQEVLIDLGDLEVRDLGDPKTAALTYQDYLSTRGAEGKAEPRAYLNLAVLIQEQDPRRALELFLEARRAGMSGMALEKSLGYAYARLERFDEALEHLQAFLELSEASPPADPKALLVRQAEREEVRRFVEERILPRLSGKAPVDPVPPAKDR